MSNISNVTDLGREAARLWGLSIARGEAGDANAIVALVQAERTITFEATVERKADDTAETFTFDIADFANPLWNADGSKDTRKMAARTAALADRLFGITELNNAIKQRLARSIKCALYIINATKSMTDEELSNAVALKGSHLVVPFELVRAEPAEDASDNDKAFYEAMKGKPLVLDGKDKASLAELSRRANPPRTTTRAAGDAKDKGASFVASVDYVTAVIQQCHNPNNEECEVAFTSELRTKLFRLSQEIASYFAVDPMEAEEGEAKAA